jgi:hypothetical protein
MAAMGGERTFRRLILAPYNALILLMLIRTAKILNFATKPVALTRRSYADIYFTWQLRE